MSLSLHENLNFSVSPPEDCSGEEHADLANLDRYLAIAENNRKACHFIPNDALLAINMAGFVAAELYGSSKRAHISTARLALALVQPGASVQ